MQDTGPGNGKNAGWCETWAFGSVADTWTGAWVSGSLGGHLDGAWVSGLLGGHLDRRLGLWLAWRTPGQAPGALARFTSKKFLRFFISQELFLTQSPSRPIEALFTAQSGLTRELLTPKFHIDPRTNLLALIREQAYSHCPVREMSLWQSSTTK